MLGSGAPSSLWPLMVLEFLLAAACWMGLMTGVRTFLEDLGMSDLPEAVPARGQGRPREPPIVRGLHGCRNGGGGRPQTGGKSRNARCLFRPLRWRRAFAGRIPAQIV